MIPPDSYDWTNAAGHEAGVYAIYARWGQLMGWRVEIKPFVEPINSGDGGATS